MWEDEAKGMGISPESASEKAEKAEVPPTVATVVQKRVVAKFTDGSKGMVGSGMHPINCVSSNDAIANTIQAINNVWSGKLVICFSPLLQVA